jgi:LPS-assembly protein
MSVRKKLLLLYSAIHACLLPATSSVSASSSLASEAIAKQLGWVEKANTYCDGYYLEQPFIYPVKLDKNQPIAITSNQTLFSQNGTSILEGKVTLIRDGQQITANKAYLYRDPRTGKLSTIDLIGQVSLREPNSLIFGKKGHYNLQTKAKTLTDLAYRTAIQLNRHIIGPNVSEQNKQQEHAVQTMTAWGQAYQFSQMHTGVYEMSKASYSTCPPTHPIWRVKSSRVVIKKKTGRGYATHARILIKNVPVFYVPYINFSIDSQRKTGFLWPRIGSSNKWGPYFQAPFYWNIAPNYDMTITPGLLSKRGVQLSDTFRYLTPAGSGYANASILPEDKAFAALQKSYQKKYRTASTPSIQSELRRLTGASTTRKSLFWQNNSQFNAHWSGHIDYSYASDDYYLRDFGNLNEITQNQLLQEGDINFKSEHWDFSGHLHAYQTLHPVDEPLVQNQYRRLPQLILNARYPNQPFGLEYFLNNEITHFDILNNPGSQTELPMGNRFHTQPGISLPLSRPYFYFNPRAQIALTAYHLTNSTQTSMYRYQQRTIPILDIVSGLALNRDTRLLGHTFQQTLEPQVYYIYIPYRNQSTLPVFDTTVNTLTYDQLFVYNRFSGLDRIGDANQISVGITTRFIDQESGLEKIRLGVGDIIYFSKRRVTLCNDNSCTDNPNNPENHRRVSPVSAVFSYGMSPQWNFSANTIWNPVSKQVDNASLALHYQKDTKHIINLGYSFVRNGNPFSGISVNSSSNNLKLTDISFAWPITQAISAVGRWSHDWYTNHFQNLLYGLQYDTCCWAVQLVAGRAFTGITPNKTYAYNSQVYVQFALKGLGNIGTGNPSTLLSSISGYVTQFGQDNENEKNKYL